MLVNEPHLIDHRVKHRQPVWSLGREREGGEEMDTDLTYSILQSEVKGH